MLDISKTQNPIQSYFRVNVPPPQNNRESFSFHSDSRSIDIFKLCAGKISLEKELVAFFHKMDNTRMVTEAIDLYQYEWDQNAEAMSLLDVGGYNYQWTKYEEDHKKYPNTKAHFKSR